jgi:hypothetical protein
MPLHPVRDSWMKSTLSHPVFVRSISTLSAYIHVYVKFSWVVSSLHVSQPKCLTHLSFVHLIFLELITVIIPVNNTHCNLFFFFHFSLSPQCLLSLRTKYLFYIFCKFITFFIFLFPQVSVQTPAQLYFTIDMLSFTGLTNISSYTRPIIQNCNTKSIELYCMSMISPIFRVQHAVPFRCVPRSLFLTY